MQNQFPLTVTFLKCSYQAELITFYNSTQTVCQVETKPNISVKAPVGCYMTP